MDPDIWFDSEVVIVPKPRTESLEVGRRFCNSFSGFVVQAVGKVDKRSYIKELVDNLGSNSVIRIRGGLDVPSDIMTVFLGFGAQPGITTRRCY